MRKAPASLEDFAFCIRCMLEADRPLTRYELMDLLLKNGFEEPTKATVLRWIDSMSIAFGMNQDVGKKSRACIYWLNHKMVRREHNDGNDMTADKILEAVKEQLEADAKKYMADDGGYYDVGFYASQILLAINLAEGKKNVND